MSLLGVFVAWLALLGSVFVVVRLLLFLRLESADSTRSSRVLEALGVALLANMATSFWDWRWVKVVLFGVAAVGPVAVPVVWGGQMG